MDNIWEKYKGLTAQQILLRLESAEGSNLLMAKEMKSLEAEVNMVRTDGADREKRIAMLQERINLLMEATKSAMMILSKVTFEPRLAPRPDTTSAIAERAVAKAIGHETAAE